MSGDLVLQLGFAALLTYLMHSTLLLGGARLLEHMRIVRSAVVRERVWKIATIGAVLTAVLQLSILQLRPVYVWKLPAPATAGPPRVTGVRAQPTANPSADGAGQQNAESIAVSAQEIQPTSTSKVLTMAGSHVVADSAGQSAPPIIMEQANDRHESQSLAADNQEAISNRHLAGSNLEQDRPRAALTGSESKNLTALRTAAVIVVTLLVVIGVCRILTARRLLTCTLRDAVVVTDGIAFDTLRKLMQQRGVRRPVRLLRSSRLTEPSAFGIRCWTILLPDGIDARLVPAELEALLAHELAHLVRRDPLWQAISRAFTLCLPWQPLNFTAGRSLRECSEFLCDRWAVAGGVRPMTLAACLTRVAEWKLTGESIPGLTATGNSLTGRVELLINGDVQGDGWMCRWHRRGLEVLLAAGVIALACFGPRVVWSASTDRTTERTDHVMRISIDGIPIDDELVSRSMGTPVPSIPSVDIASDSISRDSEVISELAALQRELDTVIQMVSMNDDEPEVRDIVRRLQQRLVALRDHADL